MPGDTTAHSVDLAEIEFLMIGTFGTCKPFGLRAKIGEAVFRTYREIVGQGIVDTGANRPTGEGIVHSIYSQILIFAVEVEKSHAAGRINQCPVQGVAKPA